VSPVRGKVEVPAELRSWADVASEFQLRRTEDWQALRWKVYQRNVYRLQRRILPFAQDKFYRATRRAPGCTTTAENKR